MYRCGYPLYAAVVVRGLAQHAAAQRVVAEVVGEVLLLPKRS